MSGEQYAWESLVESYRKLYSPRIIGSETTTIGWIYMTISILFGFLFFEEVNDIAVLFCTLILFGIGLRIWLLPQMFSQERMRKRVEKAVENIEN